ncbi:hypothetical protein D3C80_1858770 [compost metagenome]
MLLAAFPCQKGRKQQRKHGERHARVAQRHHKSAWVKQRKGEWRQEGYNACLDAASEGATALKQVRQIIEQTQRYAEERGRQRKVSEQMNRQLNMRRGYHFTQRLQESIQTGMVSH